MKNLTPVKNNYINLHFDTKEIYESNLIINGNSYKLKQVVKKWPNKYLHELFQQGERTVSTGSYLYFYNSTGACTGIAHKEALKKLDLYGEFK